MITVLFAAQVAQADPAVLMLDTPNLARYVYCTAGKGTAFVQSGESAEAISSAAELACSDLLESSVVEALDRAVGGPRRSEWQRLNAEQQRESKNRLRATFSDEIRSVGRQAAMSAVVSLRAKGHR